MPDIEFTWITKTLAGQQKLQDCTMCCAIICTTFPGRSYRQIIERVQLVRSEEVESLQLADLLIGTVAYVNRGLSTSIAKSRLVERMRERSGYTLTRTTLLREDKVNLLCWRATEARE